MSIRQYWLDLFTGATWQEFLDAGGDISGFRERRWKTVQHMKPGDYLLCYLTGVSRWIGVLEVVSSPFKDISPIWKDELFPCRVRVKKVVVLTPEIAVPVLDLQEQLTIFQHLKSPLAWTGHFRGSPTKWKPGGVCAILDEGGRETLHHQFPRHNTSIYRLASSMVLRYALATKPLYAAMVLRTADYAAAPADGARMRCRKKSTPARP